MKHLKKILVCVDALAETQGALRQAAALAAHSGAELTIIDVQPPMATFYQSLLGKYATVPQTTRKDSLDAFVKMYATSEFQVTGEVLVGRPFVEIIRKAVGGGYALVLKDAEGEGKLFAGSVDLRLLRNCPCPVWLIKPERAGRIKKILASVDPDPGDDRHRELNHAILELASSLAQLENSELHVVAAWDAPGEELLHGRLSRERFLEFINQTRNAADERLKKTLSRAELHLPEGRIHFRKGEPAPTIIETARSLDVDLLVMGTVARSGIASLLMGNTAETVLRQLQRGVLAIKPDGFVTPVRMS